MTGNERLVSSRAALEYGLEFKRPGVIRNLPERVPQNDPLRRLKIRLKIGAEVESTIFGRIPGREGKEFRLENAMLVVPQLGPRVREKNEQLGKSGPGGKRFQEQPRLCMNEEEIRNSGSITFPQRPSDSLAHDIDSHAEPIRVSLRIGRQKMTMATAEFPGKFGLRRENAHELRPQILAPLLHFGQKLG